VEENRRLADKLGLEFSILSDSDRTTIAAYGVVHAGVGLGGSDIARPATLILDEDGRVTWRYLTENWRVRVRPDAVIEALRTASD